MQFLSVEDTLREMCAFICQYIYNWIAWLYELFITIAQVEILSSVKVEPIYQRITMILAIVMVFYVTFEFVKFVVQPEGISDKEKGASKIVLKMIAVVILIAFVPNIFSGAYKLQNTIIKSQVFSKVILGRTNESMGDFGKEFSADMLNTFYYIDGNQKWQTNVDDIACGNAKCANIVKTNLETLRTSGQIIFLKKGINETEKVETENDERYVITFDALLAVGVGLFVVYMLILYCVDVAARVIQLVFLQIIAPIPIIGYLAPKKDGIFEKWAKQCLTTYLDLFIRVGIIYFILLVCQGLGNNGTVTNGVITGISQINSTLDVFVYIALIMGLMLFAKRVPDMLKELFPKAGAASGNFGINLKDRPGVAQMAGASLGMGLVGLRKMVGAGINRAKRNRLNKDQRIEDENNFNQKNQEYKQARQRRNALRNALRNGYIEEKDANGNIVRKKLDKDKTKKMKEDLENAESKLKDAERDRVSAKAARDNTKYRSALFSAVAGGVTGAAQGAFAGFKATDTKSIGKQVQEGFKAADNSLAKTEKWYNEGGGSYINRGIAAVEHAFGVSASTDRISQEIKYVDDQIKSNDVLISAESDTKAKRDDVEKRLESKLESGELKTKIDKAGLTYLQNKVPGVTVNEGDKLSDVYARTKVATEAAKSNLDTVIKNGGDVNEAQEQLRKAQENEIQMKKHAMRAAYTYMLQNPNDSTLTDELAKDKLKTMKESIYNANRNLDTIKTFEEETDKAFRAELIKEFGEDAVKNGTMDRDKYQAIANIFEGQKQAFRGEKDFADYDELDAVVSRLQNIADNRSRENMRYKETKRRIESSSATAASKADNSSVSGK